MNAEKPEFESPQHPNLGLADMRLTKATRKASRSMISRLFLQQLGQCRRVEMPRFAASNHHFSITVGIDLNLQNFGFKGAAGHQAQLHHGLIIPKQKIPTRRCLSQQVENFTAESIMLTRGKALSFFKMDSDDSIVSKSSTLKFSSNRVRMRTGRQYCDRTPEDEKTKISVGHDPAILMTTQFQAQLFSCEHEPNSTNPLSCP